MTPYIDRQEEAPSGNVAVKSNETHFVGFSLMDIAWIQIIQRARRTATDDDVGGPQRRWENMVPCSSFLSSGIAEELRLINDGGAARHGQNSDNILNS